MDKHVIPDHDERMEVARAYAGWHLGYRDWADSIIDAYLNPERVIESLHAASGEESLRRLGN